MGRRLAATVYVGDRAYGPDSDVPDDVAAQIVNPSAWADSDVGTSAPSDGVPNQRNADERAELESLSKADLVALADARGIESNGSKAEIVDRLIRPGESQ